MAFTIPDKGEGDSNTQSVFFQEYLDTLVAAMLPMPDGVLSGCGITGGADMTPAVAKGAVLSNGVLRPVAAGDELPHHCGRRHDSANRSDRCE